MQYKLAVIGNESSVLLFRALGVETHGTSNPTVARETLETLVKTYTNKEDKIPAYAVVFVEEEFYKTFPEDLMEKLSRVALPAVVPVPSPGGEKGKKSFAVSRLSKIVERAVGSDIMS